MATVDLATKLDLITDYYGAGTMWDKMSVSGLTVDQINAMYNSLPRRYYTIDRAIDGTVLGRAYTNPLELPVVPGTDFDSNIPGGAYGGGNTFTSNVPSNLVTDPTTGAIVRQTAGATRGGISLATIADRVSLAVMGVNLGAKLGLAIDSTLYTVLDKWFDVKVPALDPESWKSLCGQSEVGDFFLRTLFGIEADNMTGYVDENILAYYYQMFRDSGAFNSGGYDTDQSRVDKKYLQLPNVTYHVETNTTLQTLTVSGENIWVRKYGFSSGSGKIVALSSNNPNGGGSVYFCSTEPGVVGWCQQNDDAITYSPLIYTFTRADKTFYWNTATYGFRDSSQSTLEPFQRSYWPTSGSDQDVMVIALLGSVDRPGVDGISQLPGSTQYTPTTITGGTPQEVLSQLKTAYPDLFDGSITEKTLQPDGSIKETTYVPMPWVTDDITGDDATTGEGKTQTDTQIDQQVGDKILPTTPTDQTTQPPDTGEGSTPIPPLPVGNASSLWAVYNPSQGELNSFGAWLWSSDFVDQLKKLFADPMQAIIGVHKVFARPHTGGSQTIKCGYLDSGVSASVVSSQYTTVDCGSASLREYFGNVFDYDPFTKVSIFLPFIGVVPLNTADVMRSTISVRYRVDVITGACLAEVSVSRDGGGGILYTYGGSAIVSYPISSGSYVGAVQAALSTAIGIGSAIASGGASLGASAGMVLGGLSHAKTQVQHSGQFSGSSGAMGGKKPYLIISRPQTRTPQRIAEYEGIPTNSIHQLINCNGFTKVKEVHVVSKTAYDNEIQEIESLLKTGVIF